MFTSLKHLIGMSLLLLSTLSEATPLIEGCYKLKQIGLFNNIKMELIPTEDLLDFTARIRVGTLYSSIASCRRENADTLKFKCGVECDGGTSDLTISDYGLTLNNNHMHLNSPFRLSCNTMKMSNLTGDTSTLKRVPCERILLGEKILTVADFHSAIADEFNFPEHYQSTRENLYEILLSLKAPTTILWLNSQASRSAMGVDFTEIIETIRKAQSSLPSGILNLDLM